MIANFRAVQSPLLRYGGVTLNTGSTPPRATLPRRRKSSRNTDRSQRQFITTGHSTIKAFHGLRDGKKVPLVYLEDIEFAYTSDYIGSTASNKEGH